MTSAEKDTIYIDVDDEITSIVEKLKNTLDASRRREGMIEGFKVAIIGKPNVGKSSLLNKLLNFDRAIISDIAGTTRDTIEESVKIGTHIIKIVDTSTNCEFFQLYNCPSPTPTTTQTPTVTPTTTPTPTNAPSGFTATIKEVGGNVVMSGSGSFNLAALTFNQTLTGTGPGFDATNALFGCGPQPSNVDTYTGATFSKPSNFGPGGVGPGSFSGAGSYFGVFSLGGPGSPTNLAVPQGYVSNSIITGSTTYNGVTISGLGLTPGTYIYSWGTGGNYSILTLTIGTAVAGKLAFV